MYVHLISSASKEFFPDNNQSSFNTILEKPIDLSNGEYEVGLLEINLPFNINVVPKSEAYIDLELNDSLSESVKTFKNVEEATGYPDVPISIKFKNNRYAVKVPSGYSLQFESEQCGLPIRIYGDDMRTFYGHFLGGVDSIRGDIELYKHDGIISRANFQGGCYDDFNTLARDIAEATRNLVLLTLNPKTNLFSCKLVNKPKIRFSDHLANVLGFREMSIQRRIQTASHDPQLYPGLNAFLVYTNIIENEYVGDVKAPLLKILPFRHDLKRHQIMTYECLPVQYKPIHLKNITNIQITIADDTGKIIEFGERGRTLLTLDIREKN